MFNKHDVDIMITLMDAVESSIRDEHCKLRRVGVEMRQWSSCCNGGSLRGPRSVVIGTSTSVIITATPHCSILFKNLLILR